MIRPFFGSMGFLKSMSKVVNFSDHELFSRNHSEQKARAGAVRSVKCRNQSILAYLASKNLLQSHLALAAELDIVPDASYTGLLEKKWSVALLLQKKIMALEKGKIVKTVSRIPNESSLITKFASITKIAFIPDSDIIIAASHDTLKFYNAETCQMDRTVSLADSVSALIFDVINSYVIVSTSDSNIHIYSGNDYTCTNILRGHDDIVSGLSIFATDLISVSRDTCIKIWDLKSGFCKRTIAASSWVRAVASCENNAATSSDSIISLWDLDWNLKGELRGHSHVVEALCFSPGVLASCSRDKTIIIWNCSTLEATQIFDDHGNWVRDLSFFNDGRLVSLSDDGSCKVWDLESGVCDGTIVTSESGLKCVRVHPTSGTVATASSMGLKIWN